MACTNDPTRFQGKRRFSDNDPVGWRSPVVRLIILTVFALLLGMASARAQIQADGTEPVGWEQLDQERESETRSGSPM